MQHPRRIIFRADGNSQIGLGHVVRSLALVSMLRDEFECVFAIQAPAPALQQQIKQVCHGLIILPPCAASEDRFVHELAAYISEEELVVLDGYSFSTAYQQQIKARGAILVCVDDVHNTHFVADAVINQAGGVASDNYSTAVHTRLYLGPAYALLREPFLKAARASRAFAQPLRVLLNMGGADPENYTLQVAKKLADLPAVAQVEVVVGSAYQHQQDLQAWLQQQPRYTLHSGLSAEALCALMQQCSVAVTSASGVAYEYCAVGGLLFVLQTADNQAGIYHFLQSNGMALAYESMAGLLIRDETEMQFYSCLAAQRCYISGDSEDRLREVFRKLSLRAGLTIRSVTADDLMLVYQWVNDPEVRLRSFNSDPIQLENHSRWFIIKLKDPNCRFYMVEVNGEPAGQIRFDLNGNTALLGFLVSDHFRGIGLGHVILQKGTAKLKQDKPEVNEVEGLVQQDNIASIRAFEKAGFAAAPPAPAYPDALRFTLALD